VKPLTEQIPERILSAVEKWAKKLGVAVEEIVARLEEHAKEFAEEPPHKRYHKAKVALWREIRGELSSPAVPYIGYIIGFDEVRDALGYQKWVAMQEYESDPEGAIARGVVRVEDDGTVVPLDTRETLDDGRENPNFGQPIPEIPTRTVWMIGRPLDGGDLSLIELRMGYEKAGEIPPLGMVVKARILEKGKSEDGLVVMARSSKYTRFELVEDHDLPPLAELLETAPFRSTLDTALESRKLSVVYATVTRVGDLTERGTLPIRVMDDDLDPSKGDVTIWLHPELIAFWNVCAESNVYFLVKASKRGDSLQGYGFVPDPELSFYDCEEA